MWDDGNVLGLFFLGEVRSGSPVHREFENFSNFRRLPFLVGFFFVEPLFLLCHFWAKNDLRILLFLKFLENASVIFASSSCSHDFCIVVPTFCFSEWFWSAKNDDLMSPLHLF